MSVDSTMLQPKRDVHVLMAGGPEFNEFFSDWVGLMDGRLEAHFNFRFQSCQRMGELAAALGKNKFDLALVQLHRTPPVEHLFTDQREVLRRAEREIAENGYIVWAGLEVACLLQSAHGIPVIVVSDTGSEETEKLLAAQVGARALFSWLGIDIEAFSACLSSLLSQLPERSV